MHYRQFTVGISMNTKFLKLNMSNSMHVIALSILYVFFAGCNPPVGGPCSYEKHAGIAEVVGIKENKFQLKFTFPIDTVAESNAKFPLSRLNGEVFEVSAGYPEMSGALVGSRFHAEVSVITEGSCSPVSYRVGLPVKEPSAADLGDCSQLHDPKGGTRDFPPYQVGLKLFDCAGMTQDIQSLDVLDRDIMVMRARNYPLEKLQEQLTKTEPPRKYSEVTSVARLAKLKQIVEAYYRPRSSKGIGR